MSAKLNLIGQTFGRLTVVSEAPPKNGRPGWFCVCSCGGTKTANAGALRRGGVSSCGCLSKEITAARSTKHGQTKSRLYHIWQSMIRRCIDPKKDGYSSYGGRGITVCKAWRFSFEIFRDWAAANGYADNLTIDRIDNNLGYCPENCRWAATKEQSKNRRSSIIYQGKCVAEWSAELGVNAATIYKRLEANWPIEKALFTPARHKRR